MSEPADNKVSTPPRQSTVQPGRGPFWDDPRKAPGGLIVQSGGGWFSSWFSRSGRIQQPTPEPVKAALAPPPAQLKPQPHTPLRPKPILAVGAFPTAGSSNPARSSLYGKAAVPLAIVLFGYAIGGFVLPVILLVLWVQRRKIAPNFQPPWEQPQIARPWIERLLARAATRSNLAQSRIVRWLQNPPYNDPALFKEWIRIRLATVFLVIAGGIFALKLLGSLNIQTSS